MAREAPPTLKWMLERYVLFCVGELASNDDAKMESLSRSLQQSMGMKGAWQELIRQSVGLPEGVHATIASMFQREKERAAKSGESFTAEEFARAFVEANLPNAG